MSKNDGGVVYPSDIIHTDGKVHSQRVGTSRRDWLAGLAMQGMLSNSTDDPKDGMKIITSISTLAYMLADTMIAEGEK